MEREMRWDGSQRERVKEKKSKPCEERDVLSDRRGVVYRMYTAPRPPTFPPVNVLAGEGNAPGNAGVEMYAEHSSQTPYGGL